MREGSYRLTVSCQGAIGMVNDLHRGRDAGRAWAWLIDVAGVTEAQIAAVSSELGEQGCVNFTSALLVIEQRQRLTLAWNELFKEIP